MATTVPQRYTLDAWDNGDSVHTANQRRHSKQACNNFLPLDNNPNVLWTVTGSSWSQLLPSQADQFLSGRHCPVTINSSDTQNLSNIEKNRRSETQQVVFDQENKTCYVLHREVSLMYWCKTGCKKCQQMSNITVQYVVPCYVDHLA